MGLKHSKIALGCCLALAELIVPPPPQHPKQTPPPRLPRRPPGCRCGRLCGYYSCFRSLCLAMGCWFRQTHRSMQIHDGVYGRIVPGLLWHMWCHAERVSLGPEYGFLEVA